MNDWDVCECEHEYDDHEKDGGACQHDGAFAGTRCGCDGFKKA